MADYTGSILDSTTPVVYLRGTSVARELSVLDGPSSVTTYRYNLAGVLTSTTTASTYATAVASGAITISVRTVTG